MPLSSHVAGTETIGEPITMTAPSMPRRRARAGSRSAHGLAAAAATAVLTAGVLAGTVGFAHAETAGSEPADTTTTTTAPADPSAPTPDATPGC